jgi:3',5'-cyclic AMP phosphodiesterase CpdA
VAQLYATSDVHVSHPANRALIEALPYRPDDHLIVAGDIGDTVQQVTDGLDVLRRRFGTVIWTPGNHELWTLPHDPVTERGRARYELLVAWCRSAGVLTPEDPYLEWHTGAETVLIVPLFVLYDYSFRPLRLTRAEAVAAAGRLGTSCADEHYLYPDPHATREDWCMERVTFSRQRLAAIPTDRRTVLAAHFPLRRDVAHLPTLPLFSLWCGTEATTSWHVDYRACSVVSGHLHDSRTRWRDGVPFTDVSFGLPRERRGRRPVLHRIVPDAVPSPVPIEPP